MQVLFVHGMGRSPVSGWWMLRQLRRAGLHTSTFRYSVSRESFARVADRLVGRLHSLLAGEELVLIGHSLGGVLLRQALASLGETGTDPVTCSCSARRCKPRAWRDASAAIRSSVSRRGTAGNSSPRRSGWPQSRFPMFRRPRSSARGASSTRAGRSGAETNDGIVSLSEVSADWLEDRVFVPVVHTLLPSSSRVAAVILQRLRQGRDPFPGTDPGAGRGSAADATD